MKTSRQLVPAHVSRNKAISALVEDADYVGVKSVESSKSFESFLTDMFSYRPRLIRLLYRIRAPLVRRVSGHLHRRACGSAGMDEQEE